MRVGEEEAAAEQDLALLILLQNLRTIRCDIGQQNIVILIGQTAKPHTRVNDQQQQRLLRARIRNLRLIEQQTFGGGLVGVLVVGFLGVDPVDCQEKFEV